MWRFVCCGLYEILYFGIYGCVYSYFSWMGGNVNDVICGWEEMWMMSFIDGGNVNDAIHGWGKCEWWFIWCILRCVLSVHIVQVVLVLNDCISILSEICCVKYHAYSLLMHIMFVLYNVHHHVHFPLCTWTSPSCLINLVLGLGIIVGR